MLKVNSKIHYLYNIENCFKNKYILFKICIIFPLILYIINFISIIYRFLSFKGIKYEIKKIENYLSFCNSYRLIKKFKKNNNPKITVISPMYNTQKFISRFLRSIQYQKFDNIEIILVDDCSIDKSIKIIDDYRKKDKRIILIKNRRKKGTFIARNIGALFAKGKYLILPDSDDIISESILDICYTFMEKTNYDLIRFNIYEGNGEISLNNVAKQYQEKFLEQPKLSTYSFYTNNELKKNDYFIHNKFIKKNVYIKALNNLNNFFLNIFLTLMEDQIINEILLRTAKSFYFLKNIGYYHINNKLSITKISSFKYKIQLNYLFIYLKYVFEYSKNVKFERDMTNLFLNRLNNKYQNKRIFKKALSNQKCDFCKDLFDKIIKDNYITNENKNMIKNSTK